MSLSERDREFIHRRYVLGDANIVIEELRRKIKELEIKIKVLERNEINN